MPKSNKQKKAKVADFTKSKLKLGKGKKQASNATDTSYKARSIVLPSQSITEDKDGAVPMTKRNLTFDDLLVQAKHYNAGIRKDALAGLKELFLEYPQIKIKELTSTMGVVCKLINDEDHAVRSQLLQFFSFFLPSIPHSTLQAHLSLLLLHTSSALSHIFPEIRFDAVRVLGVLMGVAPKECCEGWVDGRGMGARIGEGLMGVLGLGGSRQASSSVTIASTTLKASSKLVVLQTLANFMSHAISSEQASSSSSPSWVFASSFSTRSAASEFETLLKGKAPAKKPVIDWAMSMGGGGWDASEIFGVEGTADDGAGEAGRIGIEAAQLYLTLHPLLLATFLDAAPSAFAPTGSATSVSHAGVDLELVAVVGDLAGTLGRAVLRDAADLPSDVLSKVKTSLRTLLGHLSVYFPFLSSTFQRRDVRSEALLLSLSLSFSSLVAQVSLTSARVAPRTVGFNPPERAKALEDCFALMRKGMNASERKLVETVAVWVASLLRGENITPSSPMGQPLPAQTYSALLPTIWSLLNQPPAPTTSKRALDDDEKPQLSVPLEVASALFDQFLRSSSDSAVKKQGLEFVGRLCLLEMVQDYHGPFRLVSPSSPLSIPLQPKMQAVYQALPKMLWELGVKDLHASETVLNLIRQLILPLPAPSKAYAAARAAANATSSSSPLSLILPALPPYFHIQHPARGSIAGPWTRLPAGSPARKLALDVAFLAASSAAGKDKDAGETLRRAVERGIESLGADEGKEERSYWAELHPQTLVV